MNVGDQDRWMVLRTLGEMAKQTSALHSIGLALFPWRKARSPPGLGSLSFDLLLGEVDEAEFAEVGGSAFLHSFNNGTVGRCWLVVWIDFQCPVQSGQGIGLSSQGGEADADVAVGRWIHGDLGRAVLKTGQGGRPFALVHRITSAKELII